MSSTVNSAERYRPAMPESLADRLRARGSVPPDYTGRGLLNLPATVLAAFGAANADDPPPLTDLDPALLDGVRQIVVVLADGLGTWQLKRFCAEGVTPFLARMLERAAAREHAQLLDCTTVFPSTTAAALTTMHTARTPQEHGNIAYFVWLDEFEQVTAMLRWGPAITRRGSYFDDAKKDPQQYVKVSSIHGRLRERGVVTYLIEPEIFRNEPMKRMHAREATYVGYILPSTMGVRLRELIESRPHGTAPSYVYAYWSGIDSASHLYGPMSGEAKAEAAAFDLSLGRAIGDRAPGDTLVMLTADHGHAFTDPDKLVDVLGDQELRAMLRNPIAGEPRLVFLHTDHADLVKQHLEERWPGVFTLLDRDELIDGGFFGRGDPTMARRRIGEVCAMLTGDRGARIMRVDGQDIRHRGSHGGMSADEMRIPVLAWRV
jgi:Type I phosphodiesterase / nucleotide pyrophosphatase